MALGAPILPWLTRSFAWTVDGPGLFGDTWPETSQVWSKIVKMSVEKTRSGVHSMQLLGIFAAHFFSNARLDKTTLAKIQGLPTRKCLWVD